MPAFSRAGAESPLALWRCEHNERLRAEHSGALRRLDTTRKRYAQQMRRVAELKERLSRYESSSGVGVSGSHRSAVLGPCAAALIPFGW